MLTKPSSAESHERNVVLGDPLGADPSCLWIGPHELAHDVLLAPLSGISDVPFRKLARRFGAALVFSEMVASGELLRMNRESLRRAMADGDGLHAVQLAGRDPATMGEAARMLAGYGVDIIDINFGCPAKKVVGGLSGSALMREPELALRIVEATVRGAGTVPVTLKMRLGWDRTSMNAAEIAGRAEAAGVRLVTVHGRTRDQFYEGSADWRAIERVKRAVRIPLVANGDVADETSARAIRAQSRADGIMIGRGACGRPWFPGLVAGVVDRHALARTDLADLVAEHLDMMLAHYGLRPGLRHTRKHLNWYCEPFVAREALAEMLREETPEPVARAIRRNLRGLSLLDAEESRTVSRQKAA